MHLKRIRCPPVRVISLRNRRAGPGHLTALHLHLPNRRVLAAVLRANQQFTAAQKTLCAQNAQPQIPLPAGCWGAFVHPVLLLLRSRQREDDRLVSGRVVQGNFALFAGFAKEVLVGGFSKVRSERLAVDRDDLVARFQAGMVGGSTANAPAASESTAAMRALSVALGSSWKPVPPRSLTLT